MEGVDAPPPNRLKVPLPLTGVLSIGLGCCGEALGAGFGAGEPPKKLPNAGAGFVASGLGAGTGSTLTAGGDENKENVPLPLGAGALTGACGAGGATILGADPPNRESVGDGLRTGAGLGASGFTSASF